jgi:leader peptidase (prepilin peptidase) / N-methyltransferase
VIAGSALLAMAASPFVGSFLGVVITRCGDPLSIVASRSRCEACGHALQALDLVPLVSWMARRGRCRFCDGAIGMFPPAIEIAALVIAIWAAMADAGWRMWATCLLGWLLLTLAIIDWRSLVLPDFLTAPLLAAGLIIAGIFDPAALSTDLAGIVAGFAIFFSVRVLYFRLRNREGIGLGDAKLLAAAGAWIGLRGLASAVLLGSLAALTIVLLQWLRGDAISRTDRVPFGAFLCLGIWLTWLYR